LLPLSEDELLLPCVVAVLATVVGVVLQSLQSLFLSFPSLSVERTGVDVHVLFPCEPQLLLAFWLSQHLPVHVFLSLHSPRESETHLQSWR